MKPLFALFAALSFAAVPTPAAAQSSQEPELDRAYLRYAATARTMRKLTDCVVRSDVEAARRLFAHSTGSAEQQTGLQELFVDSPDCLSGTGTHQLSTSGFMALGSIAENLLKADGVVASAPPSTPIPAGGGSFEWTVLRLTPAYEPRLYPVAHCLQTMHADWAGGLLATAPVSKDEREYYLRSAATLRDCVPAGSSMTLHPMYLRAALATVVYSEHQRLRG